MNTTNNNFLPYGLYILKGEDADNDNDGDDDMPKSEALSKCSGY